MPLIATGMLRYSAAHMFCVSALAMQKRANALAAVAAGDEVTEREACLLSCVMGSVGWIEAFANEIFSLCAESPAAPWLQPLPKERVQVAALVWNHGISRRQTNPIGKHALLLDTMNVPESAFKKATAWTEAALLVDFRNQLVHAEPTHWPVQKQSHKDLETKLRARFKPNGIGGVFIPKEALSIDCARWAIDTARAFNDFVCDLLGLQHKFDPYFPPPDPPSATPPNAGGVPI
jgi:hypothetical protein